MLVEKDFINVPREGNTKCTNNLEEVSNDTAEIMPATSKANKDSSKPLEFGVDSTKKDSAHLYKDVLSQKNRHSSVPNMTNVHGIEKSSNIQSLTEYEVTEAAPNTCIKQKIIVSPEFVNGKVDFVRNRSRSDHEKDPKHTNDIDKLSSDIQKLSIAKSNSAAQLVSRGPYGGKGTTHQQRDYYRSTGITSKQQPAESIGKRSRDSESLQDYKYIRPTETEIGEFEYTGDSLELISQHIPNFSGSSENWTNVQVRKTDPILDFPMTPSSAELDQNQDELYKMIDDLNDNGLDATLYAEDKIRRLASDDGVRFLSEFSPSLADSASPDSGFGSPEGYVDSPVSPALLQSNAQSASHCSPHTEIAQKKSIDNIQMSPIQNATAFHTRDHFPSTTDDHVPLDQITSSLPADDSLNGFFLEHTELLKDVNDAIGDDLVGSNTIMKQLLSNNFDAVNNLYLPHHSGSLTATESTEQSTLNVPNDAPSTEPSKGQSSQDQSQYTGLHFPQMSSNTTPTADFDSFLESTFLSPSMSNDRVEPILLGRSLSKPVQLPSGTNDPSNFVLTDTYGQSLHKTSMLNNIPDSVILNQAHGFMGDNAFNSGKNQVTSSRLCTDDRLPVSISQVIGANTDSTFNQQKYYMQSKNYANSGAEQGYIPQHGRSLPAMINVSQDLPLNTAHPGIIHNNLEHNKPIIIRHQSPAQNFTPSVNSSRPIITQTPQVQSLNPPISVVTTPATQVILVPVQMVPNKGNLADVEKHTAKKGAPKQLRQLLPKTPPATLCNTPPLIGLKSLSSTAKIEPQSKIVNQKPTVNTCLNVNSANKLNIARRCVANMTLEDLQYKDHEGDTYLHVAICWTDQHLVQAMLERIQKEGLLNLINAQNLKRQTPLYLAVAANQPVMVRLFVKCRADVNTMTKAVLPNGKEVMRAAIHCAAAGCNSYINTMRELIQARDIELNLANSDGLTALHCAILEHGRTTGKESSNSTNVVDLLIRSGANPNIQDKSTGKTPLMYAIETLDYNLVETIVRAVDRHTLLKMVRTQTFDGLTCDRIASNLPVYNTHQRDKWLRITSFLMNATETLSDHQ